jgi:hypothetical protein
MKKILYMLITISILSTSALADSISVIDTGSGVIITDASYLDVKLVNQNPIMADPGSYVDITFKIENMGTGISQNTSLILVPEYPFSLEPGTSAVQNIGTIGGLQNGNNAFLVKYRLRVDDNAVDGDNAIKLRYSEGSSNSFSTVSFNVSVSNPRTNFDVIMQDSTTLAVANIGSKTASSVIVSIPSQQNLRVSGATSSIIGTLNAGDYTLVTFQFVQSFNNSARNFTRDGGESAANVPSAPGNVTVDISYTDTLGIRRMVEKNVTYISSINVTSQAFARSGQTFSIGSNGTTYIIVGVVGIAVIVAFIKFRTRKKK